MRRTLHDLGNPLTGRPRELIVIYSQHYCTRCRKYFNADMTDLAAPGSHSTKRVVDTAVRLVIEDGLPYRAASWSLWRDHRVFVPYATIQNWVEDGGKRHSGESPPITLTGHSPTSRAIWVQSRQCQGFPRNPGRFHPGSGLSPSLDQLGAIEREASFL